MKHHRSVLIAGYGPIAAGMLRAAHEAGALVAAVPWSLGRSAPTELRVRDDFLRTANRLGIEICPVDSLNDSDVVSTGKSIRGIDLVALAMWPEILKPQLLAAWSMPVLNCHPGLLPRDRGPQPIVSMIRRGDRLGGVSFHVVEPRVDAGPVVQIRTFPLSDGITYGSALRRAAAAARSCFRSILESFFTSSRMVAVPQAEELATSNTFDASYESWVDWNGAPSQIDSHSRSLFPFLPLRSWTLGREYLTFSRIRPRRSSAPVHLPPGTVFGCTRRALVAASIDPEWNLMLHLPRRFDYRLGGWDSYQDTLAFVMAMPIEKRLFITGASLS